MTTKKKSTKAAAFLAKVEITRSQQWTMPDEIKEIIDEANRRRLEGEASSAMLLAKALKDAFEIPLTIDTLRQRIARHVGRSAW